MSLAAAARRGFESELVWAHIHQLPGDAPVLAGPVAADQARSALGMLRDLPGRLGELDADVLVDCGRLDSGSPSLEVWERADRQILVVRPQLVDLHALAAWTETRPLDQGRVRLVTVGGGAYPDSEIAEALGIEVLARVPWDPDAAGLLTSVPATARQVRVAPLVRAARSLAERLAAQLAETPPASSTAAPAGLSSQPRRRVLRGWWAEEEAPSANGAAPEEVIR